MSEHVQQTRADGDWACTCGAWHPALQETCLVGQQITQTGDDWW